MGQCIGKISSNSKSNYTKEVEITIPKCNKKNFWVGKIIQHEETKGNFINVKIKKITIISNHEAKKFIEEFKKNYDIVYPNQNSKPQNNKFDLLEEKIRQKKLELQLQKENK